MRNIHIFVSLLPVIYPVCGQWSDLTLIDYVHIGQFTIWQQAQSICRGNYKDLVTIRNEKENQIVSKGRGWIGLYRNGNQSPWKWSDGNVTANFFNWAAGEPQDNQHCTFKVSSGDTWINEYCSVTHTFVCSYVTLVLVKENKTWDEALEHCRSLEDTDSVNLTIKFWKHNYDLATLITADDHNFARSRAQEATTGEVWTGLRFLGDEWLWMGGEPVQYQDLSRCPAYRCGVLEKNARTLNGLRDCSQKRNFFCYKTL
ncbi:C-type mannose receptor 2-like [Nothobranchius furzeri]|uniref:C-type mannose receptor 2-like n=1 Tax=Nothobranchius furzeri TaxID=105023 RepID=A0A9D2Y4H9_NOTFU|nr:C-type mannose receptor 2-like [Nothobranchius furzeri]